MQSRIRAERNCNLRYISKSTSKGVGRGLCGGRRARHESSITGLLSGTDSLEREAHNLMKSITIRAQFVVEELYSSK